MRGNLHVRFGGRLLEPILLGLELDPTIYCRVLLEW